MKSWIRPWPELKSVVDSVAQFLCELYNRSLSSSFQVSLYYTAMEEVGFEHCWRSPLTTNIKLIDSVEAPWTHCAPENVRFLETTWFGTLLQRLETSFGVVGLVLDWFRSYLTNRVQHVGRGTSCSAARKMWFELPQGSVLSPLLWILHTVGPDLPSQGSWFYCSHVCRWYPDQWLLSTWICWTTIAWSVFVSGWCFNVDVCQPAPTEHFENRGHLVMDADGCQLFCYSTAASYR